MKGRDGESRRRKRAARSAPGPLAWRRSWSLLAGLRPGDYLSFVLASAVVALVARLVAAAFPSAERVVINAGKEVYEYPLVEDRVVEVAGPLGTTRIQIREGRVRVVEDPGPLQICVQEGWIESAGQWLACLPSKVLIRIEGAGEPAVDARAY